MLLSSLNETLQIAGPEAAPPESPFDPFPCTCAVAAYHDQQRLRSDLHLAMAVQRRMLPRNSRQLSTVKYAAVSAAARGIGGDYYDFLDLGPDTLGFLLADASGKGVAAALLMANLQATIRSECAHGVRDLTEMLQRVNAHFIASTLPEHYATLFFGLYDERTRQLTYINCGHQPAILRRAGGHVERLRANAFPLGLVDGWTGGTQSIALLPGDALYVCSDGVVDAGIETGCELGEGGLISVITAGPEQDIESAVARIARAACSYSPDGLTDDMTIVGLRFADSNRAASGNAR